MELIKISRYPFLSEAREWVKNREVSIEEIIEDMIYERARRRGMERVKQAIIEGIVKDAPLVNEIDFEMEIYSYAIARMIVVAFENDYALRRYALAEAKGAYEKMKEEDEEIIYEILKEFKIEHMDGKIHFSDYLKYAPTWDSKWKLVNREMSKGYVKLTKQEIARILQEAISKKIYHELAYMYAPPEIKKIFGEEINLLKNKISFKKEFKKEKSISDFPPCISSVISSINSGKNVPHVARFTLVAFLNEIGMSEKEILALFSKSPDFNEEKALYQIHHITGKISSTVYAVPKCSTIRTWGFCFPDEKCKGIFHPLVYYRRKK
ncbi:MAG: DNA primase large subunit PriL [Thermoplasmatales archaeon]|nr:DNA primase large subunit PriL [Thermoplasmatales archaeon]